MLLLFVTRRRKTMREGVEREKRETFPCWKTRDVCCAFEQGIWSFCRGVAMSGVFVTGKKGKEGEKKKKGRKKGYEGEGTKAYN